MEERKKAALKTLAHWDNAEAQRPLSVGEMEVKVKARHEFKRWALMEEMSWSHKYREIWLKEGDKNISFFHRMANSHKRHNHIKRMRINGVWSEESSLRKDIASAFQALLSKPVEWRANIQGLIFSRIFDMEAGNLE